MIKSYLNSLVPGTLCISCYSIALFLTTWRDIPKINHKFTSQFPLWNCVRLRIPYQIIDRTLPYPTISGFMYFVCFCARGSVLMFVLFLSVCLRGELMFTVPYHRNGEWFYTSHLSSFTGGCCLRDQPTSLGWSAHSVLPDIFLIRTKVALSTCRSDPEYFVGWTTQASISEKTR